MERGGGASDGDSRATDHEMTLASRGVSINDLHTPFHSQMTLHKSAKIHSIFSIHPEATSPSETLAMKRPSEQKIGMIISVAQVQPFVFRDHVTFVHMRFQTV